MARQYTDEQLMQMAQMAAKDPQYHQALMTPSQPQGGLLQGNVLGGLQGALTNTLSAALNIILQGKAPDLLPKPQSEVSQLTDVLKYQMMNEQLNKAQRESEQAERTRKYQEGLEKTVSAPQPGLPTSTRSADDDGRFDAPPPKIKRLQPDPMVQRKKCL